MYNYHKYNIIMTNKVLISSNGTNSSTFISCGKLASDKWTAWVSYHFLRALFRLLSEFLTVQIARGAQERKKKTSRTDGKEKEKKKQIYIEKS